MSRASYAAAIFWMAANDDTEWVDLPPDEGGGCPSVTATLTADLFGKDTEQVRKDLRRELARQAKDKAEGVWP